MATNNNGVLIGNLGDKPKLETTGKGTSYMQCSIAVTKNYKDNESGEWKKKTDWFRFTLWGKKAEGLSKVLDKGTKLAVSYELTPRKQEIDGKNIWTNDLSVQDVFLIGGGSKREGGSDDINSLDEMGGSDDHFGGDGTGSNLDD